MNIVVDLKSSGYFKDTSLELSPLTVLTGVNGSGKTTILNAIENQFDNVKHYKWTGLSLFEKHFEGEKGDILLFEQPEAGLHPKFQLVIADILLTYALTGRTVVVETHSDHIITRLIRRIVEDEHRELKDKIKIYFISKSEKYCSESTLIEISDEYGIKESPKDFFDQAALEQLDLMKAGMVKRQLIKDKIVI